MNHFQKTSNYLAWTLCLLLATLSISESTYSHSVSTPSEATSDDGTPVELVTHIDLYDKDGNFIGHLHEWSTRRYTQEDVDEIHENNPHTADDIIEGLPKVGDVKSVFQKNYNTRTFPTPDDATEISKPDPDGKYDNYGSVSTPPPENTEQETRLTAREPRLAAARSEQHVSVDPFETEASLNAENSQNSQQQQTQGDSQNQQQPTIQQQRTQGDSQNQQQPTIQQQRTQGDSQNQQQSTIQQQPTAQGDSQNQQPTIQQQSTIQQQQQTQGDNQNQQSTIQQQPTAQGDSLGVLPTTSVPGDTASGQVENSLSSARELQIVEVIEMEQPRRLVVKIRNNGQNFIDLTDGYALTLVRPDGSSVSANMESRNSLFITPYTVSIGTYQGAEIALLPQRSFAELDNQERLFLDFPYFYGQQSGYSKNDMLILSYKGAEISRYPEPVATAPRLRTRLITSWGSMKKAQ